MITQEPEQFLELLPYTRLNTKIQQYEAQNWIEEHIQLEPLSTVPLYELYEHYMYDIREHSKSLPLKKKYFSMILRRKFENKTEVVFYTRSCVFIRGIDYCCKSKPKKEIKKKNLIVSC